MLLPRATPSSLRTGSLIFGALELSVIFDTLVADRRSRPQPLALILADVVGGEEFVVVDLADVANVRVRGAAPDVHVVGSVVSAHRLQLGLRAASRKRSRRRHHN